MGLCTIQLEDTVIVTGGYPAITRVQEYNLHGSVARLPDLNTRRYGQACGHYTHNGQMVRTIVVTLHCFSSSISINCHVSILIFEVCGAGVYCHGRTEQLLEPSLLH